MKHIRRFNESQNEEITLTMDDVRKLKHNLGDDDNNPDSFMDNYGWDEGDTLTVVKGWRDSMPPKDLPQKWDGKEVLIYNLYHDRSELGYAILIDGKIEYLIGIYEPHGCSLNAKRGLVTANGHEEIIKLWLDDGEFEETYTR
jgi:hypothetical protein